MAAAAPASSMVSPKPGPSSSTSHPRLLPSAALLLSFSPRFYNRLAFLLAAVLALQTYFKFRRASDVLRHHEQQQARQRYSSGTLSLWEDFVREKGGQLNGSSVPVSTRKLHLLTQADVAGASMDHNMSISNPCLTTTDLLKRAFLQPLPRPFSVYGQHRFLMRAGFRTSPRDFVVVGLQLLSSTHKRDDLEMRHSQAGDCFWMGADGRKIDGHFKAVYPGEHHELMYETALYFCHLDEVTTGRAGGAAVMIIDGDKVVMHSEDAKSLDIYRDPPFFLGFCSFPMYRNLNGDVLKDWLQYHHHYVGVDYFVMHDAGSVDANMYKVLEPYMKARVMEVVDIRGEFKYETKHNVLTINACMHRMAYQAAWVLFLDFDEFLWVAPPLTFPQILRQNPTSPYVTFGSIWRSIFLCRGTSGSYVERMVFHWPHFYCVGKNANYPPEKCLNYYGHRKFVVNPRKVEAVQVHRPIEPKEGGLDLDTSVAYHNHYQGLVRADTVGLLCNDTQAPEQRPEWWAEDTKVADAWGSVKYKTRPQNRKQAR